MDAGGAQVPRADFDRDHRSRPSKESSGVAARLGSATRLGNPERVWKEFFVTRALRSQELWLTLTYLGLLLLMAKGFAS